MKKFISAALSAAMVFTCAVSFSPIEASAANPTLTVEMTQKTGPMRHGSAGFLYGLGSRGTPNANMLTPLKPGTAVQKAPDGLQHPTGDVLDVAETFIEAGGEQVQIYLQDIYALWSYEYTGIDAYLEKIKEMVPKIVALRDSNPDFKGKLVYVPYNEPDGIWFNNVNSSETVQNTFNEYWQKAYTLIRDMDPEALIGGASYATYQSNAMESWIKFCVENDCQPDCITWHELQTDKLSSFKSHLDHYRALESKYGMEEREIIINEYAPQDHCSVPGKLVNWIALFEENKVSGCLPYWHNAGNLDDIAADNNEPNGAWWLYKWYGDMSGETLQLSTSTSRDGLYGLASIDDNKKSANVLFGGVDGSADIVLKDIDKTQSFNGAEAVDIKVEATYWTAFHGVAAEPETVIQGTYPVKNGSVTVNMSDMEAYTAYNITVTAATDTENIGLVYKGKWRKTYEAENGAYAGSVYASDSPWTYAYSGGKRLSGIDTPSDGVDITVNVPKKGWYKADMVYGNGYGLNTSDTSLNDPKTVTQARSVDGEEAEILVLENTLRWQMAGMYTDYIYLDAGEHIISYRGTTETPQGASIDCLSLTFEGAEISEFDSVYEAELGDFNILGGNDDTTVTTESETEGYSASGYITGLNKRSVPQGGGVRFTVVVPDNGLYSLTLGVHSEEEGKANIYLDNTALTLDQKLTEAEIAPSEGFNKTSVCVFLQKGINIIDIDTDVPAALDYMRVEKSSQDKTVTVQAEDGALSGNAEIVENKYADGGKYVANIEGATEDALEITVNVPEAGEYKMVVNHSNSELFGAHDYNAQIVDRYASFSVNGGEAERVYFKNTFSRENWRSVALSVTLNAGENTVKVFNDNWRVLECGTLKDGTTEHIPENIDYHTLVNYAPNLDSFTFTPAVAENDAEEERFKLSLVSTDGGEAEMDKNTAAYGETVTLTLKNDYSEGDIKVTANGKDVSGLIENGILTMEVTENIEFKVAFDLPENNDEYIANNSFGTGDLTGWTVIPGETGEVKVSGEKGGYAAEISGGASLEQWIDIPAEGYYTLEFDAHGSDLVYVFSNKTVMPEGADGTVSVTSFCKDSAQILVMSNSSLTADDFRISKYLPADENLLYFVDCGDSGVDTLSDGDALGTYNSVTEQFYGADPVTGKMWGIKDEYVENENYPTLLTGKDTWPYEYDTADNRDKIVSYRYAKDQDDRTGPGVTYAFELPDGEYTFEAGFYQPSGWASVNRKANLSVNGSVIASGILPKSDSENPAIVKARATIEGGVAELNLKLTDDGSGGPMISYIKIAEAKDEVKSKKINTDAMEITGSATWNNQSSTTAEYAFDGNTDTYFDGVSGGWARIDLGEEKEIVKIGFIPRSGFDSRMQNTAFYGSVDGVNWERLFTIPSVPQSGAETSVDSGVFLTDNTFYRYIEYRNPYDYCNVAEIILYERDYSREFVNLKPDALKITYVGETVEYTAAMDAYLIYANYNDDGGLKAVKSVLMSAEAGSVPFESGWDKAFVWDKGSIEPLAVIK